VKKQLWLLFAALPVVVQATPFVDALRPYDINFIPTYWIGQSSQLSLFGSFGLSSKAYDSNGDDVSSAKFLHQDQNALAFLKGAPLDSEAADIAQQINVQGDDGVRGHYNVTGEYKVPVNIGFGFHYHINNDWTFHATLPIYYASFKDVVWTEKTKNVTADDALTRSLLTNNFFTNVSRIANGLNIEDWQETGFGDLTLSMAWMRRFLQEKEYLKEVGIRLYGGFTFPTGKAKNEDKAFSIPFGNDGAYSFPFGASIDLYFKRLIKVGVSAEFEHVFSQRKNRRIMTSVDQTNFLFLTKADARKDYGTTQKFTVFAEPNLGKGLTLRLAYHHTKHGEDKLYVISNSYSSVIANKAAELKEWTTHHVLAQLKWDRHKVNEAAKWQPQISIFGKFPFNGKRSLQTTSVGFSFALGF
jgi:hypothetical protein